ncbi:MAG: sialidase family protein [Clostridia bacterium]
MNIERFIVNRDDSIYEAWPDLALTKGGKLICVFSECTHHGNRDKARFVYCESMDRGRTWSEKKYLTEVGTPERFWNCARISRMSDDSLMIIGDFIIGNEDRSAQICLWKGNEEGTKWESPIKTPCDNAIVPDKLLELKNGRWIIAAHFKDQVSGKLIQYCWYSDDMGSTWSDRVIIAKDERYNPCEVSILEMPDETLVAFLRENSGKGYDCLKCISHDHGEHWDGIYNIPIPGCHRPVTGFLKDGNILLTYRFLQGGKGGWGKSTQNFMGAYFSKEAALSTERRDQSVRLFPIDYDRSPVADLGYSGWVQFDDGEIYVVAYIVDDAPKAHIRGYSFTVGDIVLKPKE